MNGQHTQAHCVAPVATSVVELVTLAPASENVPGSPDPWSPDVSCQGVGPSSKPLWAKAERSTVLLVATQTLSERPAWPAPPLIVNVHQVEML
jgi:hypothetical protein